MDDSYIGPHFQKHEERAINAFFSFDDNFLTRTYFDPLIASQRKHPDLLSSLFGSAVETYREESAFRFLDRSSQVLGLLEKQSSKLAKAGWKNPTIRSAAHFAQDCIGHSSIEWTLANRKLCDNVEALAENLIDLEKETQNDLERALKTSQYMSMLLRSTFDDRLEAESFFNAVDRWRMFGPSFSSYLVTVVEKGAADNITSQQAAQHLHRFYRANEILLNALDIKRHKDVFMMYSGPSMHSKKLLMELENFDASAPINPNIR